MGVKIVTTVAMLVLLCTFLGTVISANGAPGGTPLNLDESEMKVAGSNPAAGPDLSVEKILSPVESGWEPDSFSDIATNVSSLLATDERDDAVITATTTTATSATGAIGEKNDASDDSSGAEDGLALSSGLAYLAGLHEGGKLTDSELADAKAELLSGGGSSIAAHQQGATAMDLRTEDTTRGSEGAQKDAKETTAPTTDGSPPAPWFADGIGREGEGETGVKRERIPDAAARTGTSAAASALQATTGSCDCTLMDSNSEFCIHDTGLISHRSKCVMQLTPSDCASVRGADRIPEGSCWWTTEAVAITADNASSGGVEEVQVRVEDVDAAFQVICIGSGGGPMEDNLSAYLLTAYTGVDMEQERYVLMEGGSFFGGIQRSIDARTLPPGAAQAVEAVTIGHTHLDHTSGYIIGTPEMSPHSLIGLPVVVDVLREHIFNGEIWTALDNIDFKPTEPFLEERAVSGRRQDIAVSLFPLDHGFRADGSSFLSTAFLFRSKKGSKDWKESFAVWRDRKQRGDRAPPPEIPSDAYLLYFSDVGPDSVQASDRNFAVWRRAAPLVAEKQLKAIFLEVSYTSDRPNHLLFGHLTPCFLVQELRVLATLANPADPTAALRDVKVFVTHPKESFRVQVKSELTSGQEVYQNGEGDCYERNDLQLQLVFPKQAVRYSL